MSDKDFEKRFEEKETRVPPIAFPSLRNYITFGIIAAIVLIFAMIINNGGNDAPPASTVNTESPKSEPAVSAPAAKSEQTYKLNEVATAGKFEVVVNDYKTATEFKASEFSTVKTDNQFVIVSVQITNKDDRARDVSSSMFTLVDAEGKTYEAYDGVISDYLFLYETINPGISRKKGVIFETPKDIKVANLRVESGVALAGGESIEIELNAK